jgi:DNA-binding NarL/FixJ family response regulator
LNGVTALVSDLIFSTKITSTAAALGVPVKVLRSVKQLEQRLASGGATLLLLDFDSEDIDPVEAIALCRQASGPPRVVAFGSHVRADLIEACRRAGADEVLPRSAFVRRLPDLLRSAQPGPV